MRYRLHAPPLEHLEHAARRLRRLDDQHIDASEIRAHCARVALPPKWRTRDRLREPLWPARTPDNIHVWASIGASDALSMTPTQSGHPAYTAAYAAIFGAYMTTTEQDDVQPNHPALAETLHPDIVYSLVIDGDMGKLNDGQRVAYYSYRCRELGIDAAEQPFNVLTLKGKTTLYLTKAGAAALTRVNRLSVEIKSFKREGTLVIVEARASDPSGRFADDLGIVDTSEETLSLSNATMKAVTKAKRRAVIALVGLGVLDVTEVESIKGAKQSPPPRAALAPPKRSAEQPLSDKIRERRIALASAQGRKHHIEVYHEALRACRVPGIMESGVMRAPEPEELGDLAAAVDAWLQAQLVGRGLPLRKAGDNPEPIQGEIVDQLGRDLGEALPRQPGEDDPADVEPPADYDQSAAGAP